MLNASPVLLWDTNGKASGVETCVVHLLPHLDGRRVLYVPASQTPVERPHILHAPPHQARDVEAVYERDEAVAGERTVRRLERNEAVPGAGDANGAARVGAEREETGAGGHGNGRAAGTATGDDPVVVGEATSVHVAHSGAVSFLKDDARTLRSNTGNKRQFTST